MNDKIFTGLDRAQELGFMTYRLFIEALCNRALRAQPFKPNWALVDASKPVQARVDYGRWLADCECGNAVYVEPTDPLFFCDACGNESAAGKVRPVVFPANRLMIEAALLERPVRGEPGTRKRLGTQALLNPRLVRHEDAPRNWTPGQSADELRAERQGVLSVMAEMAKQKAEHK